MGIEYEVFAQIDDGKAPLPYQGDKSIESLYLALADASKGSQDPFVPVFEDQNIVALAAKRATIALEPGGQIEVATKPEAHPQDMIDILNQVIKQLSGVAKQLDIELFALGLHPLAGRNDMAKVKKARYQIMKNYMGGISGLGLDMMTRSCAIQLNLDYQDENDMVQKTRLGAALVPFYSLLCTSVAFVGGKPAGHAVERGHVWRNTDKMRCGIPSIIFEDDFGYASWIDMALDVPMYFIRRGKIYHDVAGASFREFMAHGLSHHRATVRDFVDHLSTIFTEVRLKPILELRSPDSLPIPFVNGISALTWALFYDARALNKALEIFDKVTHAEIDNLYNDVIDHGRKAQFRGRAVSNIEEELLSIAKEVIDELTQKERVSGMASYLDPLFMLVKNRLTIREWIQQRFPFINDNNVAELIRYFEPLNNPLL